MTDVKRYLIRKKKKKIEKEEEKEKRTHRRIYNLISFGSIRFVNLRVAPGETLNSFREQVRVTRDENTF